MIKFLRVATFAVLAVAAGTASAVPIGPGTFQSQGVYESSDEPVMLGSMLELTSSSVNTGKGIFTGIGVPDVDDFDMTLSTGPANDGQSFTAILGGTALTFVATNTTFVSVMGDFFEISGDLLVTGAGYDDTIGRFSIASSTATETPGFYTLFVQTPGGGPPPIPVPAALPLLAGGLIVLGLIRRRPS